MMRSPTIAYVDNPAFHQPGADLILDEPLPDLAETPAGGLPADVEAVCFRRMNYLRFKAEMDPTSAGPHLQQAGAIRDYLIRANTGLAGMVTLRECRLRGRRVVADEIRSDCYLDLVRAVDLFDVAYGVKFSSFAIVCMKRNCHRRAKVAARHSARFKPVGSGIDGDDFDRLGQLADDRGFWSRDQQKRQRTAIDGLLRRLPPRDREIITERFGLNDGDEKSLDALGSHNGITGERVRQIESRALKSLKRLAAWVEV